MIGRDQSVENLRELTQQGPGPEPMLKWFEYGHLPAGPIQDTSHRFHRLAHTLVDELPRSPERTVALRKLLEAKDAATRCAVAEVLAQP